MREVAAEVKAVEATAERMVAVAMEEAETGVATAEAATAAAAREVDLEVAQVAETLDEDRSRCSRCRSRKKLLSNLCTRPGIRCCFWLRMCCRIRPPRPMARPRGAPPRQRWSPPQPPHISDFTPPRLFCNHPTRAHIALRHCSMTLPIRIPRSRLSFWPPGLWRLPWTTRSEGSSDPCASFERMQGRAPPSPCCNVAQSSAQKDHLFALVQPWYQHHASRLPQSG